MAAPASEASHFDRFAKEMLVVAAMPAFVHFASFLRGREEFVLCVRMGASVGGDDADEDEGCEETFAAGGMPCSKPRGGAAGASARGSARSWAGEELFFLVGAYARYKRPHVWRRSSRHSVDVSADEENKPLTLKCLQPFETPATQISGACGCSSPR